VIFSENLAIRRAEAEDVATEAFVKGWQAQSRFAMMGALKSFLYTSVRNVIDAIRRSKLHEEKLRRTDARFVHSDAQVLDADTAKGP
jgi:DNA-directed RNA polymerase specialized sigma24 family protein